jgi:zinc transport system substrate-binding protein
MKIQNVIPFVLVGVALVAGCTDLTTQNGTPITSTQTQQGQMGDSKVQVVTSFYPLAELARQIGGEYVVVKNLVPAGAEPHDFEPSPKDVLALNTADLVVVNGVGFEPWAEKVLPGIESKGVQVLDVSKFFPELLKPATVETDPSEDVEQHYTYDPHFWLDPVMFITQANTIKNKLIEIDPEHKDEYTQHADAFIAELQSLNSEYSDGLKNCQLQEIVTNHAAFGYLAKRYNLTMLPISGLAPDSEPSAKRLGELTDLVKKDGVKVIFTENLVNKKISDTLAKEAGVQTMVLNPIEGLTDDQINAGENYISVMKQNLQSLRTALECT